MNNPAIDLPQLLPAWWQVSVSSVVHDPEAIESYESSSIWLSLGGAVAAPRARALVQDSVDHFEVTVPPAATVGRPFSTTIKARAADNSLVGVTTTILLETDAGEPIAPTWTEMISGTATEDVTLMTAGAGKLAKAISGTITGDATIAIYPAEAYRLELSPSSATVTAGDTKAYQATAYDIYDNEIGDVTASTTFDIDDAAGGSWDGNAYTSAKAGVWTPEGTYQGVTGTAALTVLPAGLHHIRINSAPNNGDEVASHTMDIYGTFQAWAGCYDAYDNYCGDVEANWGGTGVLAQGEFSPSLGSSTTFTPAPILSGTGKITAAPIAPGAEGDSTGDFFIKAPRLIISKSGSPNPVPAAGALLYTIVYTNVGDAVARDVRITETYDPNVSYLSAGPAPINPPPGDANVWTRTLQAIGAQSVIYLTVLVDDSMVPGTVLTNEVTIGGSRLAQDAFTRTTVVTSTPELTLTLVSDPDPVNAGGSLVYQVHCENHGNAPVNDARITMAYDDHVAFDYSVPPPRGGTENVWDLGTLDAGESGDIRVVVEVDDYMVDQYRVLSSATISGSEAAEFTAFEHTVVDAPKLELTKVAAADVEGGFSTLTYTLIFSNVGHAPSSALVTTDAIPANTNLRDCQPDCSPIDGIVTWWSGNLAAGNNRTVEMVVEVPRNVDAGTLLANHAGVKVLGIGTPTYSATTHITTTVIKPSLWLAISNGKASVEAGERLTYTLIYTNSGNRDADGTNIVVIPPLLVHDVGCSPVSFCEVGAGQVDFDIGTVHGGERGTVEMYATVQDALPAGARFIAASAIIDAVTPGDPTYGNGVQDVDEIATRPDLQIHVDYAQHTPYPGQRLTYTILYSNTGHIATTGVVITAAQPHYTTYDPDASSDWQHQGDGRYTYAVGALDHNQAGSLLFVITLPTGTFTKTMPNFDAAFGIFDDGGSGEDGNPDDNSAAAPLGVPDLIVEKVEVNWKSLLSHEPGEHVTVTLRNQGTNAACAPQFGCAGFYLDLYINEVPDSYPAGEPLGIALGTAGPLAPGATESYPITEMVNNGGRFTLPMDMSPPLTLYVRVDNVSRRWNQLYGLVPEYDELNNVSDPVFSPGLAPKCYLPVILNRDK